MIALLPPCKHLHSESSSISNLHCFKRSNLHTEKKGGVLCSTWLG